VKKFKLLPIAIVLLFVGFGLFSVHPEALRQEGFPSWYSRLVSDGHGHFWLNLKPNERLVRFGPNDADAQIIATPQGAPTGPLGNLPGGPVGGIGQVSLPGQVSGQLAITGQSTLLQVPAAGYSPRVYSKCGVSIASPLPPAANDLVGCSVTSTATVTVIASATVTQTVGAINIQAAGTPTAAINWWLIK
jgi:hypothetical protein